MALAGVVEGARHVAQQITWKDDAGNVVDISSSTLTGKLKNRSTGTVTDVDGSLDFETDGSDGVFNWTYGVNDVGTPGNYYVQFIATFGDSSTDKTLQEEWVVYDALDV